jgi:hypothetical protein
MADWWTVPYKGGGPASVSFVRPLYPPGAKSQGKTPSVDGPDVVAFKRTLSRLGRWKPWDPSSWDDSFNNAFSQGRGTGMVGDSGIRGFQRQMKLDATGWVGEKTFNSMRYCLVPTGPHAGELAMDSVAINLFQQAYQQFKAPPPGTIDDVRAAITDYCKRCVANEPGWHYSQNRPMSHLGVAPESGGTCDCSGHSTGAYFWAKKVTGVAVPDPNGCGYNGSGYTGTLIDNPKVTSGKYQVGDLAIYGDSPYHTTHVVTCVKAGDRNTSQWCSMGSESAPYMVALFYRGDLVSVVRPGLMP